MSQRGFTIFEVLAVVVIAGIMVLIGFPRLRDVTIRSDVRSARVAISSMVASARSAATQTNRRTELRFDTDSTAVIVAYPRLVAAGGSTRDTLGPVENLKGRYGTTIASTATTIGFDPRGFGTNANAVTVTVSRQGFTSTLVVSPFGRIQQ
ncbi:MAG TPA: GspH/FimT family pseudopilin [Gemmatimonadales bacterium]|nr:GspH/FimT family pseudopilin [Gemmatimonadales bacterium]